MTADDLDLPLAPTVEGDGPRDGEKEDEQYGLVPLLQQMSLAELRDIAHQRDWRVAGTSKGDYVSALGTLLSDPTETARAVTGMPASLREALRAALIADDGSGITATAMAQTMTALRCAPTNVGQPAVRPGSPGRGERGSGQAVKPVEAAALLIDLARWGLVLPWRDSLFGQGRHVLPWQVQRQLPPLTGWCPCAAQGTATAPSTQEAVVSNSGLGTVATQTRSRDAGQFTGSLYGLWEAIAAEQPAARDAGPSAAEGGPGSRNPPGTENAGTNGHPIERRIQSLLQGWPCEPQELHEWADNRRRAETSTRSLSVPPPPLLLDDAALPILAQLTQGEGDGYEELEFQCRLLCEMGLVRVQGGRLEAQRAPMARFVQRSTAEQHRIAAQAYLSLLDWSELGLLLRNNPHLTLWRRPYFAIPYDQFRSSLVRLRHLLLRFLACAGEQAWCEVRDVETALLELWPHFSAVLQGERESWFRQAWGLAWRAEERAAEAVEPPSQADAARREAAVPGPAPEAIATAARGEVKEQEHGPIEARYLPAGRQPVDWESGQGALLHLLLEGPLYWLGLVELRYRDSRLASFHLRGLADLIWDRPVVALDAGQRPREALAIDESTHTISLQPGAVAPEALTFLGRIARLEEASPERFVYHLHPRAILAAFESGASLADLLAEWERVMPQAIPQALQETLHGWWARYGQVRLYDGFGLLELRDEVTLRELEAGTSLGKHIVARLSPRMVLVRDEAVDGLLKDFAAKGYTPKDVD